MKGLVAQVGSGQIDRLECDIKVVRADKAEQNADNLDVWKRLHWETTASQKELVKELKVVQESQKKLAQELEQVQESQRHLKGKLDGITKSMARSNSSSRPAALILAGIEEADDDDDHDGGDEEAFSNLLQNDLGFTHKQLHLLGVQKLTRLPYRPSASMPRNLFVKFCDHDGAQWFIERATMNLAPDVFQKMVVKPRTVIPTMQKTPT